MTNLERSNGAVATSADQPSAMPRVGEFTAVKPHLSLPKASTGIPGLDEITGGGLPRGRTTLVTGGAGSGKSLLGMEFLVRGAMNLGEPGLLVTFEESASKVTANVASLGFDVAELERTGMLVIHSFRIDPSEIIETGDFDLEPIFLLLADSIERIGAKRIVLDTVEVLFGAFKETAIIRAELSRLFRWLEDREVTAIVTSEATSDGLSKHGVEEFVSDCVINLDHRVHEQISTRRLRVAKYRGTAHQTNEYPFLITGSGIVVLPITSVSLDYEASSERLGTGIPSLDDVLDGGLYRGSSVLVSGTAGTGKTTFGAHFVRAACARGERALLVLFEESPAQVVRNMRSVGIDLQPALDADLLRIWAARPSAYGFENHLALLAGTLREFEPTVAVVDGIASLTPRAASADVASMLARQMDLLKRRGITTLLTTLAHESESSTVGISSLVDTWLLLRNVERDGERNRVLVTLKARGTAHSNLAREFVLTDNGVELLDVSAGPEGLLTGTARLTHESRAREEDARQVDERAIRRRQVLRAIDVATDRAALIAGELETSMLELERIEADDRRTPVATIDDRAAGTTGRRGKVATHG